MDYQITYQDIYQYVLGQLEDGEAKNAIEHVLDVDVNSLGMFIHEIEVFRRLVKKLNLKTVEEIEGAHELYSNFIEHCSKQREKEFDDMFSLTPEQMADYHDPNVDSELSEEEQAYWEGHDKSYDAVSNEDIAKYFFQVASAEICEKIDEMLKNDKFFQQRFKENIDYISSVNMKNMDDYCEYQKKIEQEARGIISKINELDHKTNHRMRGDIFLGQLGID